MALSFYNQHRLREKEFADLQKSKEKESSDIYKINTQISDDLPIAKKQKTERKPKK